MATQLTQVTFPNGDYIIDTNDKVSQILNNSSTDYTQHPILFSSTSSTDTTTTITNTVSRSNNVAMTSGGGIMSSGCLVAEDINNVGYGTLHARIEPKQMGFHAAGMLICGFYTNENEDDWDIWNYFTWDGTNTSLKSAITAIYNYIDDQITDALNTAY